MEEAMLNIFKGMKNFWSPTLHRGGSNRYYVSSAVLLQVKGDDILLIIANIY